MKVTGKFLPVRRRSSLSVWRELWSSGTTSLHNSRIMSGRLEISLKVEKGYTSNLNLWKTGSQHLSYSSPSRPNIVYNDFWTMTWKHWVQYACEKCCTDVIYGVSVFAQALIQHWAGEDQYSCRRSWRWKRWRFISTHCLMGTGTCNMKKYLGRRPCSDLSQVCDNVGSET